MDISNLVINIHRIGSTIFVLLAIVLFIRSISGWKNKMPYTNFDKYISAVLLAILYIQLVAGIILYFALSSQRGGATNMDEAARAMSVRFWAIEHFIVMMFTLLLSQLGWIFIRNSKLDLNKHKNTLFYFGTSILVIIISTGIRLISR
jgi:hypothetical protein